MVRDGVILIDKPSGVSSAKVVAQVKKKLQLKKVGHAGTLDPAATGLLVCLINKATRLAQYAEAGKKRYTGEFALGVVSDTDDLEGNLTETNHPIPEFSQIEQELKHFVGTIEQVPPHVSAVKVDGKRAYARARAGESLNLRARKIHISSFIVRPGSQPNRVLFDISCSKGTYIRSLARDLGERLGCGGALALLRREESYPFSCAQAVQLDALSPDDVLPWYVLFPEMMTLSLSQKETSRLAQGDLFTLQRVVDQNSSVCSSSQMLMYKDVEGQEPLGLLIREDEQWRFGVNVAS